MLTETQGIQLLRTKGFRLQAVSLALNGLPAVVVRRPSKWGNPLVMIEGYPADHAVRDYKLWLDGELQVGFGVPLKPPTAEEIRRELHGKNLACTCALDQPCHRNVLLERAR